MDDTTRTQAILAAVNAVGPGNPESGLAWEDQVSERAIEIALLTQDRSPVVKAMDQVFGENTKTFVATILKVGREASSTRGKIQLRTKPNKFHSDGIEIARTDRTDNPRGLAMVHRLKTLKGHRVLLWVEVESISGGTGKVRVIRHVRDLGEDTGDAAEGTEDAA